MGFWQVHKKTELLLSRGQGWGSYKDKDQMLLGQEPAAAAALAVSTALALMRVTKTLHPPGGATALIAVIGGADIHRLGYWSVLLPCGAGACCMLLLALLTNNLGARRRYPQTWW